MNQPATFDGPPIMQCLLESIEDESRVRRSTGPPANDTAGEGIDHKGHVDEALPSGYIREIRKPEHVRCGSLEVAVDAGERTQGRPVRYSGFDRLATNDALKPHHSHEPCDGAASDNEVFSLQLSLHFPHAIDLEVLVEHPAYLDFHGNIIPFAGR